MAEIFITSDTHFCHSKSFLWEPRGFACVEDMNEAIVERWNSVVRPDGIVYHLGDMCLSDNAIAIEYIKRLNGTIKWLRGNHDTENRVNEVQNACPNVHLIGDMDTSWATILKSGKWTFYLSHYPTLVGNYNEDYRKFYNLCGHSHYQDRFTDIANKIYHCEMDAHDCYPVNIEEIKQDISRYRSENE